MLIPYPIFSIHPLPAAQAESLSIVDMHPSLFQNIVNDDDDDGSDFVPYHSAATVDNTIPLHNNRVPTMILTMERARIPLPLKGAYVNS
jgi:hypothetical protein